jgi:hypothetical protein
MPGNTRRRNREGRGRVHRETTAILPEVRAKANRIDLRQLA